MPLNVYTGQNPRQHVVLIEIQPNAYHNYLSQTAWATLTFFGVISYCIFGIHQYWRHFEGGVGDKNNGTEHINFVIINFDK
jgi:hypothetical protein